MPLFQTSSVRLSIRTSYLRPLISLEPYMLVFLKFHICIAYEKLADPYFFSFLSDSSWWSYDPTSD